MEMSQAEHHTKDAELCAWLREHSSGAYRRAADAADRIEDLLAELARRSIPQGDEPAGCNHDLPGGQTPAKTAETRMDAGFDGGGQQGDELPPLPEKRIGELWMEVMYINHATKRQVAFARLIEKEVSAACRAGRAKGEEPKWGAVHTVGDMVRNLLTLDQAAPIFTAFHVTIDGERRCRTRGITISRERVIDGKWIDSSRKDVPYANVIWAKPDERDNGEAKGEDVVSHLKAAREAIQRVSADLGVLHEDKPPEMAATIALTGALVSGDLELAANYISEAIDAARNQTGGKE